LLDPWPWWLVGVYGAASVSLARRPEPQSDAAVNTVTGSIDQLTATQRLGEIAEILATGIRRLRARQLGTGLDAGEQVRLDFSPERSVSPDRSKPRRMTS
jgi:hypothetical protein